MTAAPATGAAHPRVSIRSDLQSRLTGYPPSSFRIASAILSDPRRAVDGTITQFAHHCATSEASVVRFCHALGFRGFAPFRLQLAAELAAEAAQTADPPGHGADISPADSLGDAISKIAASEIVGIRETVDALDPAVLQRLVERISRSGKVALFGVGASTLGAQDLAQKLLRIGRTAIVFRDAHDALVSASLLQSHDIAIAFSHGGRTRETVAFLRAARECGAHAVAITNAPDSPLAASADTVLRTAVRETMFRSGAMASRIAQLTVADYLFVGVARQDYDGTVRALEGTYASVRELRDDRAEAPNAGGGR